MSMRCVKKFLEIYTSVMQCSGILIIVLEYRMKKHIFGDASGDQPFPQEQELSILYNIVTLYKLER